MFGLNEIINVVYNLQLYLICLEHFICHKHAPTFVKDALVVGRVRQSRIFGHHCACAKRFMRHVMSGESRFGLLQKWLTLRTNDKGSAVSEIKRY